MKLLVVSQRYGPDVLGGAESEARAVATRLAGGGHEVEVVSTCARSYITWANELPPGTGEVDGLPVHRLPVSRPRDIELFGRLSSRVLAAPLDVAFHLQREWMRLQGPLLPGLPDWLEEHSGRFDAVIFFTYLYFTTWRGIAASRAPIALRPTAHDEPPIHLPIFDGVFRLADGFAFGTPEEAALVRRRFRVHRASEVTGIGIEVSEVGDERGLRARFDLGDRPYIASVGRIDSQKGSGELFHHFAQYKRRHPGPLTLVFVGEEIQRLPRHPEVRVTGYLSDADKNAAIAGCEALIVPSHYESFSIVLAEAWALGKPALVQARSDVLVGQARRSRAALPYSDGDDFDSALHALHSKPATRARLGESGRRFVAENYSWPAVIARWERLLEAITRRQRPVLQPRSRHLRSAASNR